MRYAKYVFKNISAFIKNYTGIFMLIVVCQIVCILLTFFSFGVYQNFRNESNRMLEGENEEVSDYTVLYVTGTLPEKYMKPPKEYDGFFKELGGLIGEKADLISVSAAAEANPDARTVEFLMSYVSGQIVFYNNFYNNMLMNQMWTTGRSFTNEEFINGDKVCIAPAECCEGMLSDDIINKPAYPAYKKGDKWYVNIEGSEYECIGFCSFASMYYIPYNGAPDDIVITRFPAAELNYKLTLDELKQAKELYKKYFPDAEIEFGAMELVDNEQIYYYNTNMWLSVLIATISAVNLALIMNYILTKRRRTLAIFRITGCSANNARRIYTLEIMLILNVLFFACLAAWILWILPSVGKLFIYMQGAFTAKIYVYIYLLYMAVSYVIMTVMIARYIRKQPVDLLKAR